MRIEGTRAVALDPATLWQALRDPAALGAAMPGVEDVEVEDGDSFSAVVRPVTGLGTTPFAMRFTVVSEQPPARLALRAHGRSGENAVTLAAELTLTPAAAGTELRWSTDVEFLGVLRSVGQRVLPAIARRQVDEVLAAVAAQPVAGA